MWFDQVQYEITAIDDAGSKNHYIGLYSNHPIVKGPHKLMRILGTGTGAVGVITYSISPPIKLETGVWWLAFSRETGILTTVKCGRDGYTANYPYKQATGVMPTEIGVGSEYGITPAPNISMRIAGLG